MNAKQLLIKARDRIASPHRWRKGALGPNQLRSKAHADTCKVCALGALCWAASGKPHGEVPSEAYKAFNGAVKALMASVPGGYITLFNDADGTTHKDVLAIFDRAIASL